MLDKEIIELTKQAQIIAPDGKDGLLTCHLHTCTWILQERQKSDDGKSYYHIKCVKKSPHHDISTKPLPEQKAEDIDSMATRRMRLDAFTSSVAPMYLKHVFLHIWKTHQKCKFSVTKCISLIESQGHLKQPAAAAFGKDFASLHQHGIDGIDITGLALMFAVLGHRCHRGKDEPKIELAQITALCDSNNPKCKSCLSDVCYPIKIIQTIRNQVAHNTQTGVLCDEAVFKQVWSAGYNCLKATLAVCPDKEKQILELKKSCGEVFNMVAQKHKGDIDVKDVLKSVRG